MKAMPSALQLAILGLLGGLGGSRFGSAASAQTPPQSPASGEWRGAQASSSPGAGSYSTRRVAIAAGKFAPLFGLDQGQTEFSVQAFQLDRYPVTQGEFEAFVRANPEWAKGKVPRVYADSKYLSDWTTDRKGSRAPRGALNTPAVHVSWFAATAYCEKKGGRLPTTLEWEYVAAASEAKADASRDPEFVERILSWYGKPSKVRVPVGQGKPNFHGVHDLHGLVWEWTSDFNGSFVTADNRADGDQSRNFFCGSGVTGAAKREDYAAFMRYAMRNSLGPDFSVMNVGFRCAYEQN